MKKWIVAIIAFVFLSALCLTQQIALNNTRKDRDRYRGNTESLLNDVSVYKTKDSLNAIKVSGLELTLNEYKKFRSEDARLIKTLQAKNRELTAVTKSQSQTIIELSTVARDTVIIRDSMVVPAMSLHAGDPWYDFNGLLVGSDFSGALESRDSIFIAETVQYKRFWGFLWKTKKIKNRQVDIVNKNPHTKILNCEHITIEE